MLQESRDSLGTRRLRARRAARPASLRRLELAHRRERAAAAQQPPEARHPICGGGGGSNRVGSGTHPEHTAPKAGRIRLEY